MQYTNKYESPLGEILISADENALTGLWFEGPKYFPLNLEKRNEENKVIKNTKKWLDRYFSGKEPNFRIPINFKGTPFQNEVWKILCSIPYGKTITYGEIAKILAKKRNIKRMSAQAVGGAVGRNDISVIVPCHRVIGNNGNLTGYAGGIDKKIKLLKLEKAYKDNFFIPKK